MMPSVVMLYYSTFILPLIVIALATINAAISLIRRGLLFYTLSTQEPITHSLLESTLSSKVLFLEQAFPRKYLVS